MFIPRVSKWHDLQIERAKRNHARRKRKALRQSWLLICGAYAIDEGKELKPKTITEFQQLIDEHLASKKILS
ncbi:hypothetical protein W04_3338 [Pseudoalteromonas sp. SW0106-04]|nr:hypothetical protein W04_3338 [Pseudoalteromonas sp. SW0106-04]